MDRWIALLERQGGHIAIGVLLIFVGALLHRLGVPKAEDVLPFALGVIARSMVSHDDDRGGRA